MLGLFVGDFTVPEDRPQTAVMVLKETPTAPITCFLEAGIVGQVLMVVVGGVCTANTSWSVDAPNCEITILPGMPDRMLGHEVRHCFDREFHNTFGL